MDPIRSAQKKLLTRREELQQRRAAQMADEQELLATREADLPDTAADQTATTLLGRLEETELVELQRVIDALDRIDNGTWGICVVCGGKIPAARLRALPEADRCATCHNSH